MPIKKVNEVQSCTLFFLPWYYLFFFEYHKFKDECPFTRSGFFYEKNCAMGFLLGLK